MQKGLDLARGAVGKFAGSFSSVGSGLGSIFALATGPIGLAIGALTGVGAALKAAGEQSAAIKKLDAVLAATGNTTGMTRDEMVSLANSLEQTTNFSHVATEKAEALLSVYEGIKGDTFKAALTSAQDLAAFTDTDLNSAVEKVGRALENPARGLKLLSKEGLISPAQMASIGALVKAGNQAGAQTAILDAMKGRIGGVAEAMSSPFARFKNQLLTIAENIGAIIKPIAGIGLAVIEPLVGFISRRLTAIVPIAQRIFGWLKEVVTNTINNVVAFATPIWDAFSTFIGDALTATIAYLAPVIASLGDLIGDIFGAIISMGQALWEGLSNAFLAIAGVVGDVLTAMGINFGSLSKAGASMMDYIQGALIVLEFGFTHWKEVAQLAVLSLAYGVVKFANTLVYFFGTVMPAWLSWFGKHWSEVFTDVLNFTSTVATNIWKNLVNLWGAIEGLFEGKGFQFQWTGLTDGFKSAITELPKIAERQLGPLESSLKNEVGALANNVDKDFAKFAAERTQKVADQAAAMRNTIKHDGLLGLIPKLPDAAKAAGAGLNKPGGQMMAGEQSKLGALVRGSEDAFKATHGQQSAQAALLSVGQSQLDVLKDIRRQGGDDTDETATI